MSRNFHLDSSEKYLGSENQFSQRIIANTFKTREYHHQGGNSSTSFNNSEFHSRFEISRIFQSTEKCSRLKNQFSVDITANTFKSQKIP
ncbi:predicted protein [Sclerotinia sclerotiorum 1980 UF-70]|uniref:Uncharacterized protein n=1 Tax=Sclerotinia sclerotiorum (strain ATCC 18683 / 1980 / Ss-1) TaxID=665079 RepID=A7F696_SCLS1|nr:predicted protein [Sclerotinia sclerotiorum 1980 UF-70]EDN98267.1 predicted protein [Sclerotinia sclerotiorum 1980 UF-70]